jgi:hypothetical protein
MATYLTESEWLTTKDPHRMLDALPYNVSSRKSCLLAAAFCRRIWHLLIDARTNEPATWVRPELVCDVRFTAWTGRHLRHPIFVGMCEGER